MQHSAFPVCICRLTLAWISSETSTRNANLSWPVFLTALDPLSCQLVSLLSSVDCPVRRPSPTPFFEFLCPTPFSRSLTHFRSRRDLESKTLVWFRAKTDKGIICLADHLHSVTSVSGFLCQWTFHVFVSWSYFGYATQGLTSFPSNCGKKSILK